MSIEDIRRKAGKFRKRILWRNAREYLGAVAVIVFFALQAWHTTDRLMQAASALISIGTLYVVWHLYRKGSPRTVPAELGLASGVDFFKHELVHQRDLLRGVAKWYLGPLMPGWVLLMVFIARRNPGHLPRFALSFTLFNVVAAAFFFFVWWLNQRAAQRLQRQIDQLDMLGGTR